MHHKELTLNKDKITIDSCKFFFNLAVFLSQDKFNTPFRHKIRFSFSIINNFPFLLNVDVCLAHKMELLFLSFFLFLVFVILFLT